MYNIASHRPKFIDGYVRRTRYYVRILFQRQYCDPSAIKLLFEGVTQFHIVPSHSIIYDAKLILHNGIFYWAGNYDWDPEDANTE